MGRVIAGSGFWNLNLTHRNALTARSKKSKKEKNHGFKLEPATRVYVPPVQSGFAIRPKKKINKEIMASQEQKRTAKWYLLQFLRFLLAWDEACRKASARLVCW
jgi:hypothetical protein